MIARTAFWLPLLVVSASVEGGTQIRDEERGSVEPGAPTLVADFDADLQTAQGGWFHVVGGRPDVVRDDLVEIGTPRASAWRVEVGESAPEKGVGLVIPLYDNLSPKNRRTIRLGDKAVLELRAIGDLGKRRLRVEIVGDGAADARSTRLLILDSDALDPAAWQTYTALVPAGASLPDALVLRVALEGPGPCWIAIDRIGLGDSNLRPSAATKQLPNAPIRRQAMWVWKIKPILSDAAQRDALLAFAAQLGVNELFFQIPYEFADGVVTLTSMDAQREMLAAAHAAGIRVHALDGAPRFVLPENHARMYALVDALREFNTDGDEAERYDALHLDNEPYILPQWKEPASRQEVLDAYIELNRELRRRANAAGMEFGVDIPFWWDLRDDSGAPRFSVQSEKGRTPLLDAIFACVQNVGVMSYRERVTGPNGVVAVCQDEFALGAQHGVDVLAAVETGTGADVEPGITFGCYAPEYFDTELATLRRVLARQRGCTGIALHYYGSLRAMEARR